MASVAKQLNDMLGEIRSVRQLLDDEIRRSSQDHDEQIGLKKDLETVQSKMIDIERRVQEKLNALEEVLKEAKKRKWEIIVAIVSAFITAIAGMIVLRAFPDSAGQVTAPTPTPDPKPHSAIYSPAEPRPFLFLRGTDRGSQNPSC